MKRTLTAAVVGMLCAIGAGCAGDGAADNGSAKPSPQQELPAMKQLVGRLQSGFAGIGGEHTGWVMWVPDPDGGDREKQVEVDVSKVPAAAKVNDGKPVTARGEFIEKRYVERGPTMIFVVERFEHGS
jgi:hypothetical protein